MFRFREHDGYRSLCVCSTGFLVLGFYALFLDTRPDSLELSRGPSSGRSSATWKPTVLQISGKGLVYKVGLDLFNCCRCHQIC
jgi:hypothetical protein